MALTKKQTVLITVAVAIGIGVAAGFAYSLLRPREDGADLAD